MPLRFHLFLWRLLSPGFRCQAIEFLHILRIEIATALFSHRGKKLFGQHQTYRMHRFMPVKPFFHQSQKNGMCQKLIPEGHLVLDDHVGNGVELLVRKPDSMPPMVLLD